MLAPRKFRTAKARKRERARLFVVAATACLVLGCSLYGIHWVLSRPSLRVQSFEVQGAGSTPIRLIEHTLKEALDGSYLGIIPRDTFAFVRTDSLQAHILNAFPRIKEAQLHKSAANRLVVSVTEREPVALWCGDIVPEIATSGTHPRDAASEEAWGSCYLLDYESYIFAEAPVYTGNVFPRLYGPLTKGTPIGQYFIDPAEFAQMLSVYKAIAGAQATPQAILLIDDQELELYLSEGTRVRARRGSSLNDLPQLLAATQQVSSASEKHVAYIDLRFPGKTYFRYDDDAEVLATSTEQAGGELQ